MRFFFNIRSDDHDDIDREGIEFPTLDAARIEARRAAREMAAERVLLNERIDNMRFEITDTTGTVVAMIAFREILNLE